ncbi:hypothetical protein TSOC_004936 [Tetrabaena socialis]|uniref:Uncharacterized protein n=1 Tax=Tetrabaena socialis TaxID=47790 RepID=A0A2J8A7J3_9CHLO|nr:hypothetical protein TSOC_004936 [Tetrabaena socialis]|eukprot:PNH08504.1 hypothetical protein TSOC_004936 [Tetrabaena socialis]
MTAYMACVDRTTASESVFSDEDAPIISSSVPSVSECSQRGGTLGRIFKVPSLVFDIELEDNGIGAHWQDEDWEEEEVVSEIQRFVQPTSHTEARLLSDVKCGVTHARDDTPRLVSILTALGYRCSLRTALGGGDGADCLRNLRHTFISCETAGVNGGPARRYVVDAQFRDQFIIAKTTARYASILAAIPQVFVGPEEHLVLLVNFLCSEMSTAFRQLGSVLPPWRHASSMLSKWKPRKSMDDGAAAAVRQQVHGGGAVGLENGGAIAVGGGGFAVAAALPTGAVAVPPPPPQPLTAAPQLQWPSKVAPPHAHQHSQHHLQQQQVLLQQAQLQHQQRTPWQQQAAVFHQQLGGFNSGPSEGSRRQSFEPQRVIFGGNFAPIIPTPAPAS